MKKLLLIAVAGFLAHPAISQVRTKKFKRDSSLSRWVIDVNLLGGWNTQDLTTSGPAGNYPNALNVNTGNLEYTRGLTYGADAQLGFFWGRKRHFGIGTGFMYLMQQGDATLDKFHVEYQATDYLGNPYRQVVSANSDVRETQRTTNLNIPVVLKYKNRFSKRWGITADAGILVNVKTKTDYTNNGSLNYEAIYQFTKSSDGAVTWYYDNAPTPSVNDWFMTKDQFFHNNKDGDVQAYFNSLRSQGYNVGLGVSPNTKTGSVTYKAGTIGFIFQPSVNFFLSDKVALNLGGFYTYQPMTRTETSTYRLTDGIGTYNSVVSNVTANNNQSYGVNLGARFFVFQAKDRDGDGIRDKKDKCPDVFGLAKFEGCPDTDGDGIPDKDDLCPTIAGLVQFHGCPDTDGDGIPDKDDLCPTVAGSVQLHGCPDRDGDGIADKDDKCPDQPGLAQFNGCPDTDGDGIPDNEDNCPTVAGPASNQGCPDTPKVVPADSVNMFTPILFEINSTILEHSSYPILQDAVRRLNADPDAYVIVDGHTDNTGTRPYNKQLSVKRADAVKKHLIGLGVKPRKIIMQGHGFDDPAVSNETSEGRSKNRRAVMRLKVSEK